MHSNNLQGQQPEPLHVCAEQTGCHAAVAHSKGKPCKGISQMAATDSGRPASLCQHPAGHAGTAAAGLGEFVHPHEQDPVASRAFPLETSKHFICTPDPQCQPILDDSMASLAAELLSFRLEPAALCITSQCCGCLLTVPPCAWPSVCCLLLSEPVCMRDRSTYSSWTGRR